MWRRQHTSPLCLEVWGPWLWLCWCATPSWRPRGVWSTEAAASMWSLRVSAVCMERTVLPDEEWEEFAYFSPVFIYDLTLWHFFPLPFSLAFSPLLLFMIFDIFPSAFITIFHSIFFAFSFHHDLSPTFFPSACWGCKWGVTWYVVMTRKTWMNLVFCYRRLVLVSSLK